MSSNVSHKIYITPSGYEAWNLMALCLSLKVFCFVFFKKRMGFGATPHKNGFFYYARRASVFRQKYQQCYLRYSQKHHTNLVFWPIFTKKFRNFHFFTFRLGYWIGLFLLSVSKLHIFVCRILWKLKKFLVGFLFVDFFIFIRQKNIDKTEEIV